MNLKTIRDGTMDRTVVFAVSVFIIGLSLASTPAGAQATKKSLQSNRSFIIRQPNVQTGVLEPSGVLAPGAVVRVPNAIAAKHASDENPSENALMDWLSNNGELRSFTKANGEIKKDYFFPVEIVDPKGSRGLSTGSVVYAPIRFLTRVKGLTMVVDADPEMAQKTETAAMAVPTAIPSAQPESSRAPASLPPVNVAVGSGVAFLPLVQTHLEKAEKKSYMNIINRRDTLSTAKNYNSSCPGNFQDFKKEMLAVGQNQKIPVEILVSIMHLESSGRCVGLRKPAAWTPNVGLFQVNPNSTSVQRCNPTQMEGLRRAKTVAQLRDSALKCLENPVTNLVEAAQILRTKYAAVNTQKQPETARWDKADVRARDDWRKALAAYNGGQSYVFQSYYDVMSYNEKAGTSFDAFSWETRRVFFFRKVLDRKMDQQYFANRNKYSRTLNNILTNIAYVESIAGREAKPEESKYVLVMQWVRDLYESLGIPLS